LAAVATQLKTAPDPSLPDPAALAPVDQRLKGVVEITEAAAFEDEDICSGLVFKRKRKADVAVPAPSGLDGRAPSYREHPPSASSLRAEPYRGRMLQGATVLSLLLICLPSFNRHCSPSRPRRGWRTCRMILCCIISQGTLGRLWLDLASFYPRCRS